MSIRGHRGWSPTEPEGASKSRLASQSEAESRARELSAAGKPVVLVCDDEEPLRRLVRAALEDTNCSIAEAANGDEALELARSLGPDLIILDMVMPRRSGLEVVTELRRDPEFAHIPVIFLTARAQITDREAAAQAGVDRFLPKPFSIFELSSLVESLLAVRPG